MIVTCPHCKGDGVWDERVRLTSNPHATCDLATHICGTCKRAGTLKVTPIDSPRRLWYGQDGEYVESDHPAFRVEGYLYVQDGAGDTVPVEEGDVECNQCGRLLPEEAARPLCARCTQTMKAHARLDGERIRQEAV